MRVDDRSAAARAALALTTLLLLGPAALAQQPSQAQVGAIRQACRSDYMAHCSGVPTGGSAALDCLKQNLASLSAGCQQALSAAGSGRSAAPVPAPAAAAPAATAPAPPHRAAPPPPMSPRQELMLLRQACGPDFRRYCSGVPLGGGRGVACLQGNADRLSPRCRSGLQAARQSR